MPLTTTNPNHDTIINTANAAMKAAATGEAADEIFKQMMKDLSTDAVTAASGSGTSPTTGTIGTPEVITI